MSLPEHLTKISLYDALQKTDTINKRIKDSVAAYNTGLTEFCELPGYEDISVKSTPKINVSDVQRQLIEHHRGNQFLDDVLNGNDTFVNIVNELYKKKHAGLKAWLFPLRKDKAYDSEIEYLKEIVYTGFDIGSFQFFKPAPLGAFSSLFGMSVLGPAVSRTEDYGFAMAGLFLGYAGAFYGSMSPLGRRWGDLEKAREHAAYLDKKVEELYK